MSTTPFDLEPSPPRARARQSVDLAFELMDAVSRNHRSDVQCVLDRADVPALCLVLAAMLDDDRSIKQLLRDVPALLGWLERPRSGRERSLRPCGTHAAFQRHKMRGESIDARCQQAERDYQRDRQRAARARAAEGEAAA